MAVDVDGRLYSWGRPAGGRLARAGDPHMPALIDIHRPVAQACANDNNSLILTCDGTVLVAGEMPDGYDEFVAVPRFAPFLGLEMAGATADVSEIAVSLHELFYRNGDGEILRLRGLQEDVEEVQLPGPGSLPWRAHGRR